jgi:hypothetical protein
MEYILNAYCDTFQEPKSLPVIRAIQLTIEIIPRSQLPNHPPYRTSLMESAILKEYFVQDGQLSCHNHPSNNVSKHDFNSSNNNALRNLNAHSLLAAKEYFTVSVITSKQGMLYTIIRC